MKFRIIETTKWQRRCLGPHEEQLRRDGNYEFFMDRVRDKIRKTSEELKMTTDEEKRMRLIQSIDELKK